MADATALPGTSWRLVRIGRRMPLPNAEISARFDVEGRLGGSAGCNRYFGGYTAVAARLEIGPLATTRMACLPELDEQERRFLAALQGSTMYDRRDDRLRLSGGPATLRFARG